MDRKTDRNTDKDTNRRSNRSKDRSMETDTDMDTDTDTINEAMAILKKSHKNSMIYCLNISTVGEIIASTNMTCKIILCGYPPSAQQIADPRRLAAHLDTTIRRLHSYLLYIGLLRYKKAADLLLRLQEFNLA
jgi:hypothetical protein